MQTHPVQVQDVDVGSAQFLEGLVDGDVQRLHVVPDVVRVLLYVRATTLEICRVL